jgi:hypothetical protein
MQSIYKFEKYVCKKKSDFFYEMNWLLRDPSITETIKIKVAAGIFFSSNPLYFSLSFFRYSELCMMTQT